MLAALKTRRVDLAFGFQPSDYGVHATNSNNQNYVPIPPNVVTAMCVYDPMWFDTFGFGHCPWALAPRNTATKLLTKEIRAGHPDDYGPAQDWVFEAISKLA